MKFSYKPKGPFNLLHQNQYFNGWPLLADDETVIVMAFPVEGWRGSAGVTLRQLQDGTLDITVDGKLEQEKAKNQALAPMSADEDATGWPAAGKREAFVRGLHGGYHFIPPTKFH